VKSTFKVVLDIEFKCGRSKFEENFIVCELDGFKAIFNNTFLDTYHVDVLKCNFEFKIITKLL
jgi:hypothetical protein